MTPPPVSETAAWTPLLEEDVQWFAANGGDNAMGMWAREILRLRAENERLGKWYDEQINLAFEVRRLRAENERLNIMLNGFRREAESWRDVASAHAEKLSEKRNG